uniref:Uncharacterized protein n=1 Tax=Acrobeloides nanus TaxID=290746 RepID=A0A914E7T2_9BILA
MGREEILRYAFENNVEGIRLLLTRKIDEEWVDEETEGFSIFPLHCAAIGRSISSIVALTTSDTIENTNSVIETLKQYHSKCDIQPLHVAALYSSWKTKADINEKESIDELIISLQKIQTNKASLNGTPLHFACMRNNYNFVHTAINVINGLDVNKCNKVTNISSLHIACEYNAPEIVKLLLDNNADVHAKDVYGNTVLHYAIRCGNIEIVEMLVEHIQVLVRNPSLKGSLSSVVSAPSYKPSNSTVNLTITGSISSTSYKSVNSISHNTLANMLCQKNDEQLNPLQIAHGYDMEFRDESGRTAFHIAALYNQKEAILMLLSIKANHEANDDLGYTPLLCAASRDNIEVFKILWDCCCQTKVSFFGDSVAMVSVKNNSIKCLKYIIYKDTNNEIMGKMFMLPNLRLNTPLHVVAEAGNLTVFQMIKDYYTNINICNIDLQTPLHLAASKGHVNLVKELLNKSIYGVIYGVNLRDKHNNTPLILAIQANSGKIINLLLNHGALDYNMNPFNIAIKEGKLEAVVALLKNPRKNPLNEDDVYPLHDAIENKQISVIKMLLNLDIKQVEIMINKVKVIDKTEMTCLDLALKNEYEEGVKVILETLNTIDPLLWKKLMCRRESHNSTYSPIQMMILYMPNMADYIFTKCISGKKNIHKKTYNYEFLEDIYYMPDGTSPYICQKIDNGKLRPEAKQRNENFDSIVQTHPLTLMYKEKCFDLLEHELFAFH